MPMMIVTYKPIPGDVWSGVMMCQGCGLHFLAEHGIVRHPSGNEEYHSETKKEMLRSCSNSGKSFTFPKEDPVVGIEVPECK